LEVGKYRVGVLMDMTYNLGSLNAWVKFRQAINSNHYSQAAKEISNSLYATQVGKRAERNSAIIRDG
jgi:GH24 family phage-related lysozyme (muramidase)